MVMCVEQNRRAAVSEIRIRALGHGDGEED